ncbi:MAG: polysaccharide biosynthesis tyrosine autokinase [Actinobacteria bacterium]|nr:polysaccharide biosynthesis tyrosine autokinase [Actinomycetota bacterium]
MELRDVLRLLRAHWIGIVVLVALGTAGAFGYAMTRPRVYTASATGYVTLRTARTDVGAAMDNSQAAEQQMASFVNIGTWHSVAEYAIDTLHLDTTPQALVGQVTVTNPPGTVFLAVSANAATPTAARDLAETWVRSMQKQAVALQPADGNGAAAVVLVPRDDAALPSTPSSPNIVKYIEIGAAIGLALGLIYMLIRHLLDRRVRDPREIERQTGATVVGWLPLQKALGEGRPLFGSDESLSSLGYHPAVEAVRELRTNLQYMSIDDPPRVIVVTSPLPGDGKSVTAANLARSLADAGQHTVLIDADLRRPVIDTVFSLSNAVGLTDLLAGRASLADVAHVIDSSKNLVVLTAGRIPPNPGEVLGSNRMRELLKDLSAEATVIIDSPPTIPVSDAAVLSASADGVLTVVSAGRTTYDLLLRSLTNIERAGGRSLGVVLNKVPRRGTSVRNYGYYGYQYGRAYAPHEPTPTLPGESTLTH